MNDLFFLPNNFDFLQDINNYKELPFPNMLEKSIQGNEAILRSLAPLSQKMQALDALGNTIFMEGNTLRPTELREVILFFEKYALIYDLSFFANKLRMILSDYSIRPFQSVRFQIYASCDIKPLDVLDKEIEEKLSAYDNYDFWASSDVQQDNLANLHQVKALVSYKKASLIVDTNYKELGNADHIRYIYNLLVDSKKHFKTARQYGNNLAAAQFRILRDLGCFATLPSLENSDSDICSRLLLTMQLHILSGCKVNEASQPAQQDTHKYNCIANIRSERGNDFEELKKSLNF